MAPKKQHAPPSGISSEVFQHFSDAGFRIDRNATADSRIDAFAEGRHFGRRCRIVIQCLNSAISQEIARGAFEKWTSLALLDSVDEFWLIGRTVEPKARLFFDPRNLRYRILSMRDLKHVMSPAQRNDKFTIEQNKNDNDLIETSIGKLVAKNQVQIALASGSLLLLIDEKLAALETELPNSEEAKVARENAIEQYTQLRTDLSDLKNAVSELHNGKGEESKVVNSVGVFATGVRAWWNHGHAQICERTYDMGIFAAAVAICAMAGAGGQLAVIVSAALVGSKSASNALKKLAKKLAD